jgi:hypothetical protein
MRSIPYSFPCPQYTLFYISPRTWIIIFLFAQEEVLWDLCDIEYYPTSKA